MFGKCFGGVLVGRDLVRARSKKSTLVKQSTTRWSSKRRSDDTSAQQGGQAKFAFLAAADPRRSGWWDGGLCSHGFFYSLDTSRLMGVPNYLTIFVEAK